MSLTADLHHSDASVFPVRYELNVKYYVLEIRARVSSETAKYGHEF
jgi:hypothetical protein